MLANLTNGNEGQQNLIIAHPYVLPSIRACLAHTKTAIRQPAVSCILELARTNPKSRREIIDAGIVTTLRRICEWTGSAALTPGGRSAHQSALDGDREIVERARRALDWLEHGGDSVSLDLS